MPEYIFEDTFIVTYTITARNEDKAYEKASEFTPDPCTGDWADTSLLREVSQGEELPK